MSFRSTVRSNSNRYIQAGNAAASAGVNISGGIAKNRPRYDKIENARQNAYADQAAAAMKAEAQVTNAAVNAKARVQMTKDDVNASKKIEGAKKQTRMAGKLAGGAQMIGYAAYLKNKKDEPNSLIDFYDKQLGKVGDRLGEAQSNLDEVNSREIPKPGSSSASTSTPGSSDSPSQSSTGYQGLSGNAKLVAEAIAGPESGSWGYEAFNQGGAAGGTVVLGKSGSHKETFGSSLQDMTLQQIFDKQNMGGTDDEFRAAGGLHAVGRYQFIGPTLQDEVAKMGLDPSTTKFTPEIQDQIFLSHIKRVGNISPWIGPSNKYDQSKKDELNSMISTL